jgi:hypothetical protein
MSDNQEQQASQDEQPASDDATLDDVYKKFNVEEAATTFNPPAQQYQAQPAQQQQAAPLGGEIPDPVLDQNGFKAYIAQQNTQVSTALRNLTQLQQQQYVAETRRREEADIKTAVSTVREKMGGEVDDDFIEIALGQKARKDAKFASLYANRDKHPAAWKAALSAVGGELKTKFQFRSDPQLAENVRAAKHSTQSSQSQRNAGSSNSLDDRFAAAKSQADFDREWRQMQSDG